MRINSNTAAFNAYRNLSINDNMLSKSLEKLSSGFRINRAADDAAGLVKSESLRSEVRGLQQAVKNAQDGISFVQTAEGGLVEVHSILQRMRELAVSAANTATSSGTAEQAEITQLRTQLDAIGTQTSFAGLSVFSGSARTFQIGGKAGQTIAITVGALSSTGLSINSLDVSSDASSAITALDSAISSVSTTRGSLGATQNRLEHTIKNLEVSVENLSASESRIRDTDMALEMASFTRNQIMLQAGTAMLAQANAVPQS
ncbi:MAG: flagellin, partial [Acidimicrobiales bacterium]|nr:flagellin [Acidimicrobiales bacterium]